MKIKPKIFLLLSCLLGITAFSQDNIQFVENKGQWDPQVKYMGKVTAGAFFVHKDGFTILQHNAADWDELHDLKHEESAGKNPHDKPFNLRSHAYRVNFLHANASPKIIADKPLSTYENYFLGNDPSKWASNCKVYQGITIKDIYPNVDARYYSDKGTMKYDIVVNPGAHLSDIALKYAGADDLQVKSKELRIKTSVGEMRELAPYSYQYRENGRADVPVKYMVKGNEVRFEAKDYDPKSTLIIDPSIVFCSYTGSSADNWGFTATYGPDGSMYGGGIVFAQGFPTSVGAFQTSFAGGGGGWGAIDIGVMKLTPDGSNRVYATYIGGSGNDMPQSLIVDQQGNLIIAGRSNSGNYPTTNTVPNSPGGGFDIIITKLNATGTGLIGSIKMGGTSDDGANITAYGGGLNSLQQNYGDEARSEVNLDGAGNIYLSSCTNSLNNFPVTAGAFQTTAGGGYQDGVVVKFNPNLSTLLFSSFIGGKGNDAAYVLSINPFTGNLYIAGGTASNDLKGSTVGTVGPTNNGAIDGFISIVSPDGSTIQKTTYIGTAADDQIYGLQFDLNGFPYVMGQTKGTFPVQNAAWSQPNGKQFIVKLQPDLSSVVYSTTFGKGAASPDISPVAFLVDRCENVYISGWGGNAGYPNAGTDGLSVTPDAFKTTTDGGDFYFFVLKKDATGQLFGSFYGKNGGFPDHVDGGTSRFDKNGVIYEAICADCKGSGGGSFPTTAGAWATNNPSPNCNLAMLKINLDLSGVHGKVQASINGVPRDTSGCVPLAVDFRDTIQTATAYEWQFGDGSPQIRTTTPSTAHTYNSAGFYTVMMVAIDSSKCFPRDTSYTHIRVSDLKAFVDFDYLKLQPCTSYSYSFSNKSLAPPSRPFGSQSFTWDFGDGTARVTAGSNNVTHSFASPGTYKVKLFLLDTSYCNSPDSVVKDIRVASTVKADFDTPPLGCAPYDAVFTNNSQGGAQFIWNFGDGSTSTDRDPTHTYNNPGAYVITLVAIDSATCNIIDSFRMGINVYAKPTADFDAQPQPPVLNTPISFTNLSSTDAIRFKWEFGDGDSLVTTSRILIKHEYNSSGNYNACLTAYNQVGCSDRVCKQVTTIVEPAVDVPTAFTPLSGDINSKIFVKGYAIGKMKFTIWARWGEKVFETDTKAVGWDGRFKGKLLPMDAYAYTLDVEFTDGSKVRKKGDITLIR
ncbi:MAG: PKD domain-containing protein [Candidatus Dadabacteria bacterium]